jgi:hypothetical protein
VLYPRFYASSTAVLAALACQWHHPTILWSEASEGTEAKFGLTGVRRSSSMEIEETVSPARHEERTNRWRNTSEYVYLTRQMHLPVDGTSACPSLDGRLGSYGQQGHAQKAVPTAYSVLALSPTPLWSFRQFPTVKCPQHNLQGHVHISGRAGNVTPPVANKIRSPLQGFARYHLCRQHFDAILNGTKQIISTNLNCRPVALASI